MKHYLFLLFLPAVTGAQSITIGADEWFPMNGDPNSVTPGFMIEIAENALKINGMSVDYRIAPWERAIFMAREGKIDCIVGASPEEVPDFIFGEEEYARDQMTFYVNNGDSWKFNSIESLDGKKIGTISGYSYSETVDNWLETNAHAISGNNALEKNIKKLQSKRIDVVIESKLVMDAKLKEMNLTGQIVSAGTVDEQYNLYIACGSSNPESPNIVSALDIGIKKLRAKGEVNKIMSKYGLADWKVD
ncbi:amino acid ABC transporter substrate-binding protein [Vibrio pectenicida]|uniref:Amino acid ABC transporter substrate-binding protein n=1 Tax=Vibrio pectenicida TaxID=62763 RepID=A0A7Y4EG65_9VIBR|nr:transporter substrate-binding domain-containing protein [Vibrio pectenicida]NOH73342.1 amino acid ABC transporter substrate-binding protein [Vibrio pectenicida]